MQQEDHSSIQEPRPQEQQPCAQPPLPAPPPGMVWLPWVANDRTNFAGVVAGFFLFPLLLVPMEIGVLVPSRSLLFLRLGVLLFFLLLHGSMIALGIKVHQQAQRWKQVCERRLLAATAGFTPEVPLAEPQPVPNLRALPLTTIQHQVNWLPSLAWPCLLVCSFLLIWMWFFVLAPDLLDGASSQAIAADVRHHFLVFSSLPSTLLIYTFLVLLSCWGSARPQRIEVTPEGVKVKHPGSDWFRNEHQEKKQMIFWQEARLFAIRDGKPGGATVRYELSGPYTVLIFDRILRPSWWSRFQPAQSFGEYNAQMDALLALISAHTGLLLYDVRPRD